VESLADFKSAKKLRPNFAETRAGSKLNGPHKLRFGSASQYGVQIFRRNDRNALFVGEKKKQS